MTKAKTLRVCGQAVPFDGHARFEEIGAYDAAIRADGGTPFSLLGNLAPVIINARLRPATPFVLEGHAVTDEDTMLAVLDVVTAIEETLDSSKVRAALGRIREKKQPQSR